MGKLLNLGNDVETINFTGDEMDWLEALKQNKNYNYEEFISNFYKKNSKMLSIAKYRNYLLNNQSNNENNNKTKEMMELINNKDYQLIKKEFEKMFLESFEEMDIDIIINIIKNEDVLQKVIQIHNNKKTDRLMSILTRI